MPKEKFSIISGDNVNTSEEDNSNFISMIKESFDLQKPDINNISQVNAAIEQYLERCSKHNIRPGNMGLYNALGITRQEVNEYLTGRRKASNEFIDILKKAKAAMAEYREILGSHGKIAPPTIIFWQKNHDNFTDVQQIELNANTTNQPEMSTEEIRKQIENDIPIDSEYREIE